MCSGNSYPTFPAPSPIRTTTGNLLRYWWPTSWVLRPTKLCTATAVSEKRTYHMVDLKSHYPPWSISQVSYCAASRIDGILLIELLGQVAHMLFHAVASNNIALTKNWIEIVAYIDCTTEAVLIFVLDPVDGSASHFYDRQQLAIARLVTISDLMRPHGVPFHLKFKGYDFRSPRPAPSGYGNFHYTCVWSMS